MTDRARKERWVGEAIAITDVITKNGGGRYLCPLCVEWFANLDDLTLEHAPPESVGGRHIAWRADTLRDDRAVAYEAGLRARPNVARPHSHG
jgi:hypothetical protein